MGWNHKEERNDCTAFNIFFQTLRETIFLRHDIECVIESEKMKMYFEKWNTAFCKKT